MIKDRRSGTRPAGQDKGPRAAVLEQGAKLLQSATPLKGFDVYVVGFHCAKGEPDFQMEAHHYCRVVNDDLLQCVLFDGNTGDANLIGVEYIVSGRLFDGLPDGEKPYWHPHNYELLSGQLAAPGLPAPAEKAFLELLVNSYGKTWHTWHTNGHGGQPGMDLPRGEPKLMWSFNRDGECDDTLRRDRDRAMGLDTDAKRADRRSFLDLVRPQWGVDAMKDDFPRSTPVPGVTDAHAGGPDARA
ncbi:outer membrane or secreted lipoprotein [Streptomyces caatingaensis]|uniref:Outer membrane or secreted lipoprotein n=2 Tax=Streptomyces caatingaensis TaxID=1678637 RepID=A0A0K9XM19_9ACTN|nr:outer membrane or secreted lipoprotein [Streptomyces caatingaensis]